ncbi:MAG: hypothetical protein QN163_02000 [Armatimonadota bacterium]|nr:hypothetical protein [Armatimonadota bacterium]MDR5696302.1 hypothetical protein [Armatimonadota bacterium]
MIHEGAPAWAVWLEATPPALWMRQALWAYPVAEIVHITGIAVLVGSVAMWDLRLLGLSRGLPVSQMARHLLPWAWGGFAVVGASGVTMFVAHPTEWSTNPVFPVKMGLIGVAWVNQFVFHRTVFRSVAQWDRDVPTPRPARIAGATSLAVWVSVIACGRLLAYL